MVNVRLTAIVDIPGPCGLKVSCFLSEMQVSIHCIDAFLRGNCGTEKNASFSKQGKERLQEGSV